MLCRVIKTWWSDQGYLANGSKDQAEEVMVNARADGPGNIFVIQEMGPARQDPLSSMFLIIRVISELLAGNWKNSSM